MSVQLLDLERKCKLQDMHAQRLQQKLENEKAAFQRLRSEHDDCKRRIANLEDELGRTVSRLEKQFHQVDLLSHEKTVLLNKLDNIKVDLFFLAFVFKSMELDHFYG